MINRQCSKKKAMLFPKIIPIIYTETFGQWSLKQSLGIGYEASISIVRSGFVPHPEASVHFSSL